MVDFAYKDNLTVDSETCLFAKREIILLCFRIASAVSSSFLCYPTLKRISFKIPSQNSNGFLAIQNQEEGTSKTNKLWKHQCNAGKEVDTVQQPYLAII